MSKDRIFKLLFHTGSVLALVGSVLVARQLRIVFVCWLASNGLLMAQGARLRQWNLVWMYLAFFVSAAYGLWYWSG